MGRLLVKHLQIQIPLNKEQDSIFISVLYKMPTPTYHLHSIISQKAEIFIVTAVKPHFILSFFKK